MSQLMSRPVEARAHRVNRNASDSVRLDAIGELFAGAAGDLGGLLGLHHVAGAFGQQGFDVDAVDHVEGVEDIAFRLGHFLALLVAD